MSAANVHFPNPPGVNPDDDATGELIGWAVAMVILSGLAVCLRFVARFLVRHGNRYLYSEDWLALAALPFAWIMCFVAVRGSTHDNFGRHIGASTPASLHRYLIGLWIFELAYNFAITLAKLSIIALWWRIFDVRSCHICLIVVGVLEILWLVACTFVLVFSCVPVNGFWDLDIPSQCIQQSHYWIGAAVPNIAFDIILLILPNFWIMRLSISRSQKLALCFIFMLGIFVVVCSSLRLWQLILYNAQDSEDLPWVMVGTAIWSMVEGNLSVVCCCLPSMRPLLRLLVHGHVNYGYDYSRNRYGDNRIAPTPIPNANAAWGVGNAGVQLKPIPAEKILESPTSPRDQAANWPLSPQTPFFATTTLQADKPASVPHRPRNDSFSRRIPSRQGMQRPDAATWLSLDQSTDSGTRPVSELSELERRGSRQQRRSENVDSVGHSRTNTFDTVEELERQLSVASVGAARRPRF